MITKAQGHKLTHEAIIAVRPKLSAMERGMLTWVVLDPGDKVLDVNSKDGLMLEYLARHMECEICGVSSNMEHVKQVRTRLQNADIMYSGSEDIPWRENTFDAVFMRKAKQEEPVWEKIFQEALRVLKPGGQFLLGVTCYPAPFRQLASLLAPEQREVESAAFQSKQDWLKAVQSAGFQQGTWQQTDITGGLIIGWKPMVAEKDA